MTEQLGRLLPLVALKLPGLARGKDGDDARPVVRLELVGRVDEDEAHRVRRDGGQRAGDVQDVGRGGAGVGWLVEAVDEEGFDVGHAEQGGGRGREEDDGFGTAAGRVGAGFFEVGDQRVVLGSGNGSGGAGARARATAEEEFGGFADVREVLDRVSG